MTDEEKGRKLLTAVERIVASSDSIRATVEAARAKVKGELRGEALREATARELIRGYSNRAAIAGGASGLPGLIPGFGSIALAIGGGLAELTFLLKWEVEMALGLSHLYGFDIDDPRERQLGYLMASVGTYDATGKNFFVDVMKVEGTAIWNYAPRAAGRMVVSAMAMVAAIYLWRGLLKAVPFVGMAVGSSMNKVLTTRVGARCMRDCRTRRELMADAPKPVAAAAAAKKSKAKPKPKASAKPKSKAKAAPAKVPSIDDLN
ncbi:MAG: hypothetical protein H6Q89_856 [Myxococcaceae bacterium]|nr:hypothetical protein [Myxococcaceae bacterium]